MLSIYYPNKYLPALTESAIKAYNNVLDLPFQKYKAKVSIKNHVNIKQYKDQIQEVAQWSLWHWMIFCDKFWNKGNNSFQVLSKDFFSIHRYGTFGSWEIHNEDNAFCMITRATLTDAKIPIDKELSWFFNKDFIVYDGIKIAVEKNDAGNWLLLDNSIRNKIQSWFSEDENEIVLCFVKDKNGNFNISKFNFAESKVTEKKKTFVHISEDSSIEFEYQKEVLSAGDDSNIQSDYVPIPVPVKDAKVVQSQTIYNRDVKQAIIAKKRSNYACESCCQRTFIKKSDGHYYTEAHHLIPIEQQDQFENSIDVPANIVSLCSNCHNQIHYGRDYLSIIEPLFQKRKDELKCAGIEVDLEQLKQMYN